MKRIILGAMVISLVFTGCFNDDKKENKESETSVLRPVVVIKPIKKNSTRSRSFNAISKADKQIKLSFKVNGSIERFDLNIGDFINKGDIIAKLDAKPYKIQEQQSSYALVEAKANLKNAKSSYDRIKKLYINQNASQSELDSAKANFSAIKAKVSNAKEQLSYSKLQSSYTILTAPKNGFVASVYVQKDENVNVGTPLILLSDKDVLDVTTQVPENFINSISKGDAVNLTFDSIKDETFKAQVSEVAKIASEELKTFQVTVKLKQKDARVKSGMASTIVFYSNTKISNVLEIPSASVLNDNKGHFVYVAVPLKDNLATIKRKDIEVGKLTSTGYEVLDGLELDDLVLRAGMSQVFENLIVKLR